MEVLKCAEKISVILASENYKKYKLQMVPLE